MTTPPPRTRPALAPQPRRNPGVYCDLRRSGRARHGFTLIEILVAISIIALLVALTAIGATVAQSGAQRSRTGAMAQALLGAQDEFKAQYGQGLNLNHAGNAPVNWGGGAFNRNAPGATGTAGGAGLSSSERLVVGCLLFDSSGEALRAAVQGRGALVDNDGDGFLEIRDPWENEVAYRSGNGPASSDFDGVDHNDLPTHRDPMVVSPGKDGDFGTDDDISSTEIGS